MRIKRVHVFYMHVLGVTWVHIVWVCCDLGSSSSTMLSQTFWETAQSLGWKQETEGADLCLVSLHRCFTEEN